MTTDRHDSDVRDACRTLGVSPSDDLATIRAAWRDLVRSHHPDRRPCSKKKATAKIAAINSAWDTLFNYRTNRAPAERAATDLLPQCSPNEAPARTGGSARPVGPVRTTRSAGASKIAKTVRHADGSGRTPRASGQTEDEMTPRNLRKLHRESRAASHGYSRARNIWEKENSSAFSRVDKTA